MDELDRLTRRAARALTIARHRLDVLTELGLLRTRLQGLGVAHSVDLVRSGDEELAVLTVDLTDASMDGRHGPQGARTPAGQDPGCAGAGGAPGHAPPAAPADVAGGELPRFLQRWS